MKSTTQYNIQFEEIYVSFYSRMKRFAQSYVIYEEDAENIVQDIFINLWEKKTDFSSILNLSSFLFMILKNRCIDFIRQKTTEDKAITEIQKEYNLNLKLKQNSLESINNSLLTDPEIDAIIHNAIKSLPERCREIFIKNKFEGKKQKEIAEELNISIHTVESQMSIAYKKLKVELKDYLPILILITLI